MKLVVPLVVAAALAASAFVGTAGAAPLELKLDAYDDWATDGTDVYVVSTKWSKDRHGDTSRSSIVRRSLIDGSAQKLATFEQDAEVYEILAGGGSVYVTTMLDSFLTDSGEGRVEVLRLSADGSSRVVLASGQSPIYGLRSVQAPDKRWVIEDCEKAVGLTEVSESGVAILAENVAERSGKKCGGKQNRNIWTYSAVTPSGAKQTVLSVTKKLRIRRSKGRWRSTSSAPVTWWDVSGNSVLYRADGSHGDYVVDLPSGQTAGPYVTAGRHPHDFGGSTVDPQGRVAVNDFSGKSWKNLKYQSGVFRTPGDVGAFSRFDSHTRLAFCGSRLVGAGYQGVNEFNVATFGLQRLIVTYRRGERFNDCNSRFVYTLVQGSKSAVLRAYPLD